MKSLNNSVFVPALLTALVVSAVFMIFSRDVPVAVGSTINLGPALQTATTSGSVSVTTSTRLMATTSNPQDASNQWTRIYATVCNPNANPVYLALDGDQPASLANSTYVIAAAAGYDVCFTLENTGYNGSITASSTNQSATVINYMQYTQ
jgi:hypothetical protein